VATYDLHGGSVTIDIADVGTADRTFAMLHLQDPSADFVRIEHGGEELDVRVQDTGQSVKVAMRPWNPAEHYWRIDASGGTMIWEVSTDAVTWIELYRAAPPIAIAAITVRLMIAADDTAATQIRYDDVVVCGP
jgi:hypothetical protein